MFTELSVGITVTFATVVEELELPPPHEERNSATPTVTHTRAAKIRREKAIRSRKLILVLHLPGDNAFAVRFENQNRTAIYDVDRVTSCWKAARLQLHFSSSVLRRYGKGTALQCLSERDIPRIVDIQRPA